MRLLVFGAAGRTGREIVVQALAQGHTVTAFDRHSIAAPAVIRGDVLDYSLVETAVQGQDAVLSALGVEWWRKNTILSDGTRNILQAMEQHDVRRFICVTSLGVGDSKDQLGRFFARFIQPVLRRTLFRDKEQQEQHIKACNRDWIIIRPTTLTNGPCTGNYRCGASPTRCSIFSRISRADVAKFMLGQLTDAAYLRQALAVWSAPV